MVANLIILNIENLRATTISFWLSKMNVHGIHLCIPTYSIYLHGTVIDWIVLMFPSNLKTGARFNYFRDKIQNMVAKALAKAKNYFCSLIFNYVLHGSCVGTGHVLW